MTQKATIKRFTTIHLARNQCLLRAAVSEGAGLLVPTGNLGSQRIPVQSLIPWPVEPVEVTVSWRNRAISLIRPSKPLPC